MVCLTDEGLEQLLVAACQGALGDQAGQRQLIVGEGHRKGLVHVGLTKPGKAVIATGSLSTGLQRLGIELGLLGNDGAAASRSAIRCSACWRSVSCSAALPIMHAPSGP